MWQSCAHARIECGNPVPTPGLTVGRVNGEKNTPEAMLRGQHHFRTFGAGPVMGFSAKYRSRNPDLGGRIPTSVWRGLGRAPMPGRFAETVGLDDSFEKKNPGKNPDPGAGSAGLRCRAGAAGRQECGALGVGRARAHWASPHSLGEPVLIGRAIKRGWASQYSLGEPVLGEPSNEVGASHQTRLGRAIKRGWGEPSNEVGRASTKGPLGEPSNEVGASHQTIKRGWASHSTFTAASTPASKLRLLGAAPTVPARHIYLVPARHIYLVPARHV